MSYLYGTILRYSQGRLEHLYTPTKTGFNQIHILGNHISVIFRNNLITLWIFWYLSNMSVWPHNCSSSILSQGIRVWYGANSWVSPRAKDTIISTETIKNRPTVCNIRNIEMTNGPKKSTRIKVYSKRSTVKMLPTIMNERINKRVFKTFLIMVIHFFILGYLINSYLYIFHYQLQHAYHIPFKNVIVL